MQMQTQALTGNIMYAQLPRPCTVIPVSGRLLLVSLGTIGFREVTETNGVHPYDVSEINLAFNDCSDGERKWPGNWAIYGQHLCSHRLRPLSE